MDAVLAFDEAGDLRITVIAAAREAAVVETHLFAILDGGEVAAGRPLPRFVGGEHDLAPHRLMQLQGKAVFLGDEVFINEQFPARAEIEGHRCGGWDGESEQQEERFHGAEIEASEMAVLAKRCHEP
jgi:hypothetical protein